jgi:fibrillarin-like rRNA methylase
MQEVIVEFYTEVLEAGERDPQRASLAACILSGKSSAQVRAEARILLDGVAANAVDAHGETLEPDAVGFEVKPLDTFLERLRVMAAIMRNDQAEAVNRTEEHRE